MTGRGPGEKGRRGWSAGQIALVSAGAGAALLYPLVFTLPFHRHVVIMILLYAVLAQAWNILAGYCGQISLGNAVFFGTGAYASSLLFMQRGVTPWLGMAAGILAAVFISQIIGYPCFRLRGHYFAIATIAIGEIVQTVMINWDAVGGARGLSLPILPESLWGFEFHKSKYPYYYIALAMAALIFFVAATIERSKLGYYFRAIREDPEAAQSLGINITRYKLIAIALSAAFTAMGGTFYAQYILFIDPESTFPLALSILICLIAIVGGVGTVWGPLVGAAVMIPLSEVTRISWGGTGRATDLLLYGAVIVLTAVFRPQGLAGIGRVWGPTLVALASGVLGVTVLQGLLRGLMGKGGDLLMPLVYCLLLGLGIWCSPERFLARRRAAKLAAAVPASGG